MQSILEQITDWLKSMIISGIMGNLSGMFDSVNQQVGQIAGDVGTTPANFSPAVFSMIRNISESVILPIAGMVLTFIACYELIQMLIEHNNLANFETWTFFKWVFKTFLAVTLISNTFNITMAVFDVAQQVISRSGGLISGSTSVSDATLTAMQATLEGMDLGPLLGLYLQTFVVQVTMLALSAIILSTPTCRVKQRRSWRMKREWNLHAVCSVTNMKPSFAPISTRNTCTAILYSTLFHSWME